MKKITFFAMGLISITTYAQTGRVGINTDQPNASLEIRRHNSLPVSNPQGLILPKYSTTDRDKFILDTDKQRGLMIYNLTKNCIDWWNGTKWQCMDSVQENTLYSATKTYNGNATFARNNCPSGYTAGSIVYNGTATGTATSTISQADADSKALAQAQANYNTDGQAYANSNATCTAPITTYTSTKSASYRNTFTKNNCPSGYTGSQVTYITPTYTETRTSTVSQTDADNLAQAAANTRAQQDLNANGQNYANNNGTCTLSAPSGATTTVGTKFACEVFGNPYKLETNLGIFTCEPGHISSDYATDYGYWFWNNRGNANAKDYGLTDICYGCYGSDEYDESHQLVIGKVGTDGSVITWARRVN